MAEGEAAAQIATLYGSRSELWRALDAGTASAESITSLVSSNGGRGAVETISALVPDGDPHAELTAVTGAVQTEITHLRTLEREISSHESAIAEIERRKRMIQLAIAAAIVVTIIIVVAIVSSLTGGG